MNKPLEMAEKKPFDSSKNCASCQKPFSCNGATCWCQLVSIDPIALKKLECEFNDCLCFECLKIYANPTCHP